MQNERDLLEKKLAKDLTDLYGPIMGGKPLRDALGFKSADAMRQALSREQVGVPTFKLPHRQGPFSFTEDVARWLAEARWPSGHLESQ